MQKTHQKRAVRSGAPENHKKGPNEIWKTLANILNPKGAQEKMKVVIDSAHR